MCTNIWSADALRRQPHIQKASAEQSAWGLVKQMEVEKGQIRQLLNLSAADVVEDVPEDEESQNQCQAAWDDVSGKELDPTGVRAARALEIKLVDMKEGMEENHQEGSE